MPEDYWKKIENLRKQQEAERQNAIAETESAERVRAEQARIEYERKRTEEQKRIQVREIIRSSILSKALPILEDIQRNSPDVRSLPISEIVQNKDSVILQWGNKLHLTSEEAQIISKYYYKPEGWTIFIRIPEQILVFDGYMIKIQIYSYSDNALTESGATIGVDGARGYISLSSFLNEPSVILPLIAERMQNLDHKLEIYQKGIAYWRINVPYQRSSGTIGGMPSDGYF